MADDERVQFSVTCPECRKDVMVEYRSADIVGALINGRPVHLYAECHERSWRASYIEMQQIRGYLGATWLDAHRPRAMGKSHGATDDATED